MPQMKKLPYRFLFLLLLAACNPPNAEIAPPISAEIEPETSPKDTTVDFYLQSIHAYYDSSNSLNNDVELAVKGMRAYEDDSILILTFDEILKFGSWHYSNASLCFYKNGDKRIPIGPIFPETTLLTDYYQSDLNYPNRIDGELHQIIDLTGDGKPEYIFRSEGMVRTNFEEKYNFYQLNLSDQSLKRAKFLIESSGMLFSYPTIVGQSSSYSILENDAGNPLIEVKTIVSELAESQSQVKELSCKNSYFVWDNQASQFVGISNPKRNLD